MLKGLVILGALVVVAIGNAGKENNRTNLAQYDSGDHAPPALFIPIDKAAPTPEAQTTDPVPPHWYKSPEWWLCILGIPTLCFIGWQAKATADAATATKEAAETTLKQMDLYVNAERARIAIDISSLGSSLMFRAKNIGKTNARITRMSGFTETIHQKSALPEIPKYLTPAHKAIDMSLWLGQGDATDIEDEGKDAGNGNPALIADLSSEATRNNIQMHGWNLWIFGQICYRDGISPQERELRFCYGIGVDKQHSTWAYPDGPASYRKDT